MFYFNILVFALNRLESLQGYMMSLSFHLQGTKTFDEWNFISHIEIFLLNFEALVIEFMQVIQSNLDQV